MAPGHEGEPGTDLAGPPRPSHTTDGCNCFYCTRNLYHDRGMARLEHDVVTLPADQQALGLVEAILSETRVGPYQDRELGEAHFLKIRLSIIQGNGERVKVLLETPEAAASFESLADKDKRTKLLKVIDRHMQRIRTQHTVEHVHVQGALNGVLDANDRTLRLPPEVIDMEFAEAMLEELDRFTGMIWPYEEEDFRKRTMGSFCGIGVQIRKEAGRAIEVVTPLADTPAFRAKLRAGDLIMAVNGKSTKLMRISRAVKMITGKRYTTVKLTIKRAGRVKPFLVKIKRDIIHIRTVKGWRRLPGGKWDFFIDREYRIGYVRLTQFTSDTIDELRRALRSLRNDGASSVILDLRFNPGGLLTSAVDVADEFLRRGLIVSTKGRNVPKSERSATALGEYQSGMLVVLANR
ncbi:hypothetical protein LCGC14_2755270, partial [marine sediment metagenome]